MSKENRVNRVTQELKENLAPSKDLRENKVNKVTRAQRELTE